MFFSISIKLPSSVRHWKTLERCRLDSDFYLYINNFRKLIEDIIGIAVYCCGFSSIFFFYEVLQRNRVVIQKVCVSNSI